MPHTLPPLPYEYNALEPHVDEQTMRIHHGKHHQTYVDKLNAALQNHPELQQKTVEELILNPKTLPKKAKKSILNHGGGHLNHSFFWTVLKKDGGQPTGEIAEAINKKFKSYDKFKEKLSAVAMGTFGSGWTWLVLDKGKLKIVSTPNQDIPQSKKQTPLLVIDLWEHAYYLKYQNRRAEYVAAFWNIINWEKVNENFVKAKTTGTVPS